MAYIIMTTRNGLSLLLDILKSMIEFKLMKKSSQNLEWKSVRGITLLLKPLDIIAS